MSYVYDDQLDLLVGRDIRIYFVEFEEDDEDTWAPVEIERYAVGTLILNDEDSAYIYIMIKETDAESLKVGVCEIIGRWIIHDIEAIPLSPDDFYTAVMN